MPAPYPIEIPVVLGFNSKVFDLSNVQQITPSGRGYIQTFERSTPMWVAQYQTPVLRDEIYDQAIGFLGRLRGSMNTFLAYDPRRPMPRAYKTMALTADPWTRPTFAAPRVVGFDYEFGTLSLDRLATGAVITTGDYVSFFYDGIWYLFRSLSNAVAGSGGIANIEVEPRPYLPEDFTNADVRYRKACCEMKILGKYEEEDTVESGPSLSWKAVQFLNRSTPAADADPEQIWRTHDGRLISDEDDNIILF